MKSHRQFTVGSIFKNNQKVPLIRLSGLWLAKYGFRTGHSIHVRVLPGSINLELQSPPDDSQSIEGFLVMHHQGHYAICNRGGLFYELRRDDCVAVELAKDAWVKMTVTKDLEGYYLKNEEISFYPKIVYGRLLLTGAAAGVDNSEAP